MLPLSIFQSVEFYIIISLVAVVAVGWLALPSKRGPAKEFDIEGQLLAGQPELPSVEYCCLDNGDVALIRRGLEDCAVTGTIALKIEVRGFDVDIKERFNPGWGEAEMSQAMFMLDFLGRERYHIKYTASDGHLFAAVHLHNRPGISVERKLEQ